MILLLGGTSESIEIAQALNQISANYLYTAASDYGEKQGLKVAGSVRKGRLDSAGMLELIQKEDIHLVMDGTHPFAVEVSKNAMQACADAGIPYFRYERPSQVFPETIRVQSIAAACKEALKVKDSGRIYLTTGSKNLPQFLAYLPIEELVIRILPTSEVLAAVEKLGFQVHQIEAMKGPFSQELNQALMVQNNIGVLITKETGDAGGFKEKVQACKVLDIPCIVIEREKLEYPQVFAEMEDLITAIKDISPTYQEP